MSGLTNALVILVVVGAVIARQLRPRRVSGGGRWWLIPGVLAVLALRDGGLVDSGHQELSAALLTGELLTGAGLGWAWAATTRIWKEPDGGVWAQGTRATVAVWVLGIAVRIGLYGAGAAAGVHQHTGSVLLAVAVTLLIRMGGLLRARSEHGVAVPYGLMSTWTSWPSREALSRERRSMSGQGIGRGIRLVPVGVAVRSIAGADAPWWRTALALVALLAALVTVWQFFRLTLRHLFRPSRVRERAQAVGYAYRHGIT